MLVILLLGCDEPAPPEAEDTAVAPAPDTDTGGCRRMAWLPDADADGYGNFGGAEHRCEGDPGPVGHILAPACYYDDDIEVIASCDAEWHDCDDTDSAVNPAAAEIWYDGIDQRCDGDLSDGDADGDGYDAAVVGGADCDDTKPSRHPAMPERCDGDDDDCDGVVDGPTCGTLAGREDADHVVLSGVPALEGWTVERLGDVDGDGTDDLLVTTFGNTDYVLADVRAATSLGADAVATVSSGSDAYTGAAGDLDGDGLGDLWIVDRAAGTAAFWPGPLTGTILPTAATWPQDEFVGFSRADVTGDGVADVIAGACLAEGPVARGDRAATRCVAELPEGARYAGDLDGDGLDDLVLANVLTVSPAYVFHAPFDGVVDTRDAVGRLLWEDWTPGAGVAAPVGDVDGDGLPDLAAGDWAWSDPDGVRVGGGSAYVVLGPGTGSLDLADAWARIRGEPTSTTFGWSLHGPGDLDGDGRSELVVTGADSEDGGTTAAWVLGGLAPGTWTAGTLGTKWLGGVAHEIVPSVDAVTSGDLDGDAVLDLIFRTHGGDWEPGGDALWIVVP